MAWNRILSKRTDISKRHVLSSLLARTSRADQIESRKITRLQQIVLGLIDVVLTTNTSPASVRQLCTMQQALGHQTASSHCLKQAQTLTHAAPVYTRHHYTSLPYGTMSLRTS